MPHVLSEVIFGLHEKDIVTCKGQLLGSQACFPMEEVAGKRVGMGMQQWMFSMHFDAIRRGAYEDIPGMTGWSKKNLERPQGLMDWEQNKKNGRREAR